MLCSYLLIPPCQNYHDLIMQLYYYNMLENIKITNKKQMVKKREVTELLLTYSIMGSCNCNTLYPTTAVLKSNTKDRVG